MKCKEVALARRPTGFPQLEDFEVREIDVNSQLSSKELLVQLLWLSIDPYLRTRMNEPEQGLYMPAFEVSKVLQTMGVAKVIDSADPNFEVGDVIQGMFPVSGYAKITQTAFFPFRKVPTLDDVPLSYHLGALGMTSFTAWVGLVPIAQIQPGEEVFVSAASGAVGIAVGQLAKAKGCRVVGSAGSDEKVRLLKEEFGFDDAFNYKAESDWNSVLGRMFPNGIDVYFENVGGAMLEAVLNHINKYGRIPVCGMISQYNKEPKDRDGVHNLMVLVGKEVTAKGFLIGSYVDKMPAFMDDIIPLVLQQKFKYKETVTEGLENFGSALIGMLRGDNIGKALVHAADP